MKKKFNEKEIELLRSHLIGVKASILSDTDFADLKKGKLTEPNRLAVANRLLSDAARKKNEVRKSFRAGLNTPALVLDIKVLERALIDAGVLTLENISKARMDLTEESLPIVISPL